MSKKTDRTGSESNENRICRREMFAKAKGWSAVALSLPLLKGLGVGAAVVATNGCYVDGSYSNYGDSSYSNYSDSSYSDYGDYGDYGDYSD